MISCISLCWHNGPLTSVQMDEIQNVNHPQCSYCEWGNHRGQMLLPPGSKYFYNAVKYRNILTLDSVWFDLTTGTAVLGISRFGCCFMCSLIMLSQIKQLLFLN